MVDNYLMTKMKLQEALEKELNRYRAINRYGKSLIIEQEIPEPEAPAEELPAEPIGGAEAPDPNVDADIAGLDDIGAEDAPIEDMPQEDMDTTEEIDITDLVNMTKSLKRDFENSQVGNDDVLNKMNDVFSKLDSLAVNLQKMDSVLMKIEDLGQKVENMKPETPQEKLEMRSLDSYPFNQKPNEFFNQKREEMRASGKNEYVLTKNDINDYTPNNIKNSFSVAPSY